MTVNAHDPSVDDPLRPTVPLEARRARWALSLIFLLNGASFCAILPRYPELVESIGLSNTAFGLAMCMVALYLTFDTVPRFLS